MDIQTAFYHGRIQLVKTVLDALGPIRVQMGLTAFDDGMSAWSHCFFGIALQKDDAWINRSSVVGPERTIQAILRLKTIVPIRFTWTAFDGEKATGIKREDLKQIILDIQSKSNLDAATAFLSSIDFDESAVPDYQCQVS